MNKRLTDFSSSDSSDWKDSPILLALWYDARGNWEDAHHQVDQMQGKAAARVHAYLHRKEGDIWNADYWYGKAGEKRTDQSLDQEWEELVKRYLL